MTYPFCFTVFTPTYNRKETLHRTYNSLMSQSCKDFEWVIVDDGSTDGTETLVGNWQKESWFPIRYFYQANGGKHRAFNRGVREAQGYQFLCLDSDDSCTPEALETFRKCWEAIPIKERSEFSGVTVHSMDCSGKLIGSRFPENCMDMKPAEMSARYGTKGEKWGFHRTEVLKQFPFPEIDGETFVSEGLVWNRIGSRYRMRYVNRALRIYWHSPGGLAILSRKNRVANPKGARLYYKEALRLPLNKIDRAKNLLNYIAFSLHARTSLSQLIYESGSPCLTRAALPAGYLLYRHGLKTYRGNAGGKRPV